MVIINKYVQYLIFLLLIYSCNRQSRSGNNDIYDKNKHYKLKLNPSIGSQYYYDINNETTMNTEVNEQKISNNNKVKLSMYYNIQRDTSGNYVFNITYDKIHINIKSLDGEKEMDASNAVNYMDPNEKMLILLKNAHISAIVDSIGNVIAINGYKGLTNEIMQDYQISDSNSRKMIQDQLEKQIGNRLIRQNMDQMFKIFPDSIVKIGDKWKLKTIQKDQLNLNIESFFTLSAINSDVAIIKSHSIITSDKSTSNLMGYNVQADLKGEQNGEYEIETKTGMIINTLTKASIVGNLLLMPGNIPIKCAITTKISGRKIK